MRVELRVGDCLDVMREMEANSVDTIVTDPPYGLKFMGKGWDHGVPGMPFWEAAWRVAKPGALLLAFGGTRTWHRLACAIEDAGWEIRDTIVYCYGSGFPKSHDISKAIDKAAGAEREVVGPSKYHCEGRKPYKPDAAFDNCGPGLTGNKGPITTPATDLAREWDGWGTALKPAWEPVLVAMKPLEGTFAENAERWGVAGLWVEGARIRTNGESGDREGGRRPSAHEGYQRPNATMFQDKTDWCMSLSGRWPANLIHNGSDEVRACFPVTGPSQVRRLNGDEKKPPVSAYGDYRNRTEGGVDDNGGSAARFFQACPVTAEDVEARRLVYQAKAGRRERWFYCRDCAEAFPAVIREDHGHDHLDADGKQTWDHTVQHPTQKPLSLMRYLVRLTRTPSGGVVLDPFMGSGTTGMACALEGRDFIGIELDAEYVEIARRRIVWAQEQAAKVPRQAQLQLELE